MNRPIFYMLICTTGMMLLFGCEAATRTRVLSFFFDDAPKPEDQTSPVLITQAGGGTDAKNKDGQPQKAFKHGPFGARLCSACHDPNTNALLLPKNKLCFKCHDVPTKTRRQHGPVASGGCLVCHEPHSGSSEALLVAPAKEFCLYCHDRKEIYARAAHQGIDESCTVCHNPHGSDSDFLLRESRDRR